MPLRPLSTVVAGGTVADSDSWPFTCSGVSPLGNSMSASGLPFALATSQSTTAGATLSPKCAATTARDSLGPKGAEDEIWYTWRLEHAARLVARGERHGNGLDLETARGEGKRLRRGPLDPMPLHAGSGEDVHIDACGAGVFEQRRLADTGGASEHKRTSATGAGVRQ